jgi:hypothetical protein
MQQKRPFLILILSLLTFLVWRTATTINAGSSADTQVFLPMIVSPSDCNVTTPPTALGLDPFYQKYCAVNGLPIVSSGEVPDDALEQAALIIKGMLNGRPDIIAQMVNNNTRVGIIGINEVTTDLPEYADLYQQFPGSDWDSYRGIGATPFIPVSSVGEENLLCYSSDPYLGESIMVHEFSHSIKIMALEFMDADFHNIVNTAYQSALSNNLWDNTYAGSHVEEYWAEGVQSYFETNFEADPPDGVHNHVNTRAELQAYDPTLYQLIDDVFQGIVYTPVCP